MKINNTIKLGIALSTFVALMSIGSSPVEAVYGSDVILIETPPEEHVTIDAGLEDVTIQLALTGISLMGTISTAVLFKKIK